VNDRGAEPDGGEDEGKHAADRKQRAHRSERPELYCGALIHRLQRQQRDALIGGEIDVLRFFNRNRKRAHQRLRPSRQHQRRDSRQRCQNQAVHHQHPRQPQASRADGSADGDFPLALHGACDQQICDIEAREQQHQADDRHRDRRRGAETAQLAVALPDHAKPRAAVSVRFRPVPRHRGGCGFDAAAKLGLARVRAHLGPRPTP
jgi:hypothetical protein